MHTLLNYRVLGTSTATVFLSNDHSLYAPIYLGWTSCLISFAWDQSTCQERIGSDKNKMKNSCPQWDSNPQPWVFKSDALQTKLAGLVECCPSKWPYYIHVLPIQCLHCYKYLNLNGQHSTSPASSVGRASDLKCQGCGFESHCGQEFFILYFVALDALLTSRLVSCKWNQAWRPSDVYRFIERMIIWKKTVAILVPSTR